MKCSKWHSFLDPNAIKVWSIGAYSGVCDGDCIVFACLEARERHLEARIQYVPGLK